MPSLPPAIELHVTTVGKGLPVLALHDIGKDAESMHEALAPLADDFRLVIPDQRGHGSSPTPGGPWSVDDFASDAARVIAAEGGEAIVVGIGLGALAALALTLGHSGLVSGLVLSGIGAGAEDQEGQDRWVRLARAIRESGGAEGVALAAEAMGGRPDWRGALSQLSLPAIVLGGADDQAVEAEAQRDLAVWLPGARFVVAEGSGHDIVADAPARLVDAVRALVSGSQALAA